MPSVRVLRLGNSYDIDPNIPKDENKVTVSDRILGEGSDETVETTVRTIWPDPALPDLIDKWLDRYRPEVVLLVVSSYWFTYVSVPVRVERSFGPVGKPMARAGLKVAATPWLAHNAAFRAVRRATIATLGGATHFTPEEVVASMQLCVRKLVARENLALVVRGPRVPFAADGTATARLWAEERRSTVDRQMAAFCKQLHVEYIEFSVGLAAQELPESFQGDLVHGTTAVHADQGRLEGEAMLRAWQARRAVG